MKQQASYSNAAIDRVDWVDSAKGICIILVVMMHTTLGLEAAVGQIGWMHAVVEFARPFRMPDFFLISGLFLAATIDRPWRLYLDRKVVHFFYFYLLWVIIQFVFKAPMMLGEGQSVSLILRSLAFTLIQPFGTLWFIYMLPVFFVVTKLFRNYPWQLLVATTVLQILPIDTTVLLPVILEMFSVTSVDSHWLLIDEFCSFYVYFLAGYLFSPKLFELAKWAQEHTYLALGLVAFWFLINLVAVQTGFADLPLIGLLLGGAGAAAIVVVASLLSGTGNTSKNSFAWFSYLGANSIVIYLAFFIPMVITRLLLVRLVPGLDVGSMVLVSIIVSVVTPMIGYTVIKQTGFGGFLFHRPNWAIIARKPDRIATSLQPAE